VGGPARPNTSYAWDFGDGGTAATAAATHRYADDGLYVAKLTTDVSEPGGVVTRHFAAVRVMNVPPMVDAGPPLTIDEGQLTEFVAGFTDPGWLDTHTAFFDFGDDSAPIEGAVTATHTPPAAAGTARATHAYCDDGEYRVTVRVRDDDGGEGVATRRVTVRNVPPKVDAGPDLFAYPCTPITLVAAFTDPGWCDTHTATWDFGDCTPPFPATVRERHEPPEGCGIAAATHVYNRCGVYHAVCSVLDDDGGSGLDALEVRVVDVRNAGFESGFHTEAVGTVANHWSPYGAGGGYAAEEFVVHGGQRAQRVTEGGIRQFVGANPGWDYQVSAWYHAGLGAGVCRLGLDAAGGTDPAAASVAWMEGAGTGDWSQLSARATAAARQITLFLEYQPGKRVQGAFFDDVALVPYPCPLGDPPPCRSPEPDEVCVEWRENPKPRLLGPFYKENGFGFTTADPAAPLRIVAWGDPAGMGKLLLPPRGMTVELPFPSSRVVARVASYTAQPIRMDALDQAGATVASATAPAGGGAPTALDLRAPGIHSIRLSGGGGEGVLIQLCATKETEGTGESPHHR
jgi:PKD repeat protein